MGAASAFYARASTAKQLASLDAQVTRLRGEAPGAEEFVDRAVSGRADDRPELDRLKTRIRAGLIGEVVATRLDRVGRNARGILEFFDLCADRGVRLRFVDQSIDTSTAVGRFVRTGLAAAAELEADLDAERTQETMDQLRDGTRKTRSGRPVGRPRKLTLELAQRILQLRGLEWRDGKWTQTKPGLQWGEIAFHVHLPTGTCKKVPSAVRPEKPGVENGGLRFASSSAASQHVAPSPV